MTGAVKLVTAGSGAVNITAASSVATDVAVQVPSQNCTLGIQGPAFSVQNGVGNSAANVTNVKITYNGTSVFDTNSNYNSATSRFTPTVAGYYQINATAQVQGGGSGWMQVKLFKNGAVAVEGCLINCFTYALSIVSNVIYMNGTTDYLEIYAIQSSGTTQTITGLSFNGCLVRAA